jgi:hypothetical protein
LAQLRAGENTTRALLYVALTRGRESNTAYLYQRTAGEADHQNREPKDVHLARRGSNRDAAHLMRNIVAANDGRARTAHDVTATTERGHLPEPVGSLVDRRTRAVGRRRRDYSNWQKLTKTVTSDSERWRGQQVGRTSSPDNSIHL